MQGEGISSITQSFLLSFFSPHPTTYFSLVSKTNLRVDGAVEVHRERAKIRLVTQVRQILWSKISKIFLTSVQSWIIPRCAKAAPYLLPQEKFHQPIHLLLRIRNNLEKV